jgi:hypothetical protein
MRNLDLVISVDTSVFHLASGIQKTLGLLSTVCDWRLAWGQVWYPQAKLFRSRKFEFDHSVAQVIAALQERFGHVQKGEPRKTNNGRAQGDVFLFQFCSSDHPGRPLTEYL